MKMHNAVIASVLLVGAGVVAHAEQAPVVNAFAQQPVQQSVQQPAQPAQQQQTNNNIVPSPISQAMQPPPQQVMVQGNALGNDAQSMLLQKLSVLQTELQQLRGKLEVQQHDIKLLQEQQRTLYKDLDKRLTRITNTNNNQQSANGSAPTISYGGYDDNKNQPATTAAAATNITNNAAANSASSMKVKQANSKTTNNELLKQQLIYKAAYKEIRSRNFSQALTDFQMFVQQYPNSRYAPNAHYWMGELFLLKNDVNNAIKQFQTVISKNPQDPKAADAMYKLGFIYYNQSKWQQAKQTWHKVIRQFPQSNAAQLSRSRLQQATKEGH